MMSSRYDGVLRKEQRIMRHENDMPEFNAATVFRMLADMQITRVEVRFSGGGDEGGVDEIIFYQGDEEIDTRSGWSETEPFIPGHYDETIRRYVNDRKPTEQEILLHHLDAPIYEEYGTFAGDYQVQGTLTWDVAARTCKMNGSQTSESWVGFEHEF